MNIQAPGIPENNSSKSSSSDSSHSRHVTGVNSNESREYEDTELYPEVRYSAEEKELPLYKGTELGGKIGDMRDALDGNKLSLLVCQADRESIEEFLAGDAFKKVKVTEP